jgi:uncharacterized YigZ family protein
LWLVYSVMPDYYTEPAAFASAEIKVKGSRFLAQVARVQTTDAALQELRRVKKKHYDATHNCSAWRIGSNGEETRFSDDGEPNGTAGTPILRHIEGADITNVIVVVTRYYGGTKLGTGGLARAYGDAAGAALEAVRRVKRTVRDAVVVQFDYADTSPAMHTIGQYDVEIADSVYGDKTELSLAIRQSQTAEFKAALVEALAGRANILSG